MLPLLRSGNKYSLWQMKLVIWETNKSFWIMILIIKSVMQHNTRWLYLWSLMKRLNEDIVPVLFSQLTLKLPMTIWIVKTGKLDQTMLDMAEIQVLLVSDVFQKCMDVGQSSAWEQFFQLKDCKSMDNQDNNK